MIAESPKTLERARQDLAAEWTAKAPFTPAEIAAFYRETPNLKADLDAWHATESRQSWTAMLVHVAKSIGARCVVDIGCGGGHDLRALRDALPDANLFGVEPNERVSLFYGATLYRDISDAPIEGSDLLVCIDVLEHVPDPGAFLAGIANRAKPNAVLFEATATHDYGTPLHLPENRGWHPGNTLETHGWELIDGQDRVRVWQRMAERATARAGLLVCAYRELKVPTHEAILTLLSGEGWRRHPVKHGDGLISRSRSAIASRWWLETADDVFLMLDDDIVFPPEHADRLVALARERRSIACGAYPVRNGGHVAFRGIGGDVEYGPDVEPVEIMYAATGFMACHRAALDALIPTMPLCHGGQPWAFWPLFLPMVVEDEAAGGHSYLSEDYAFCHRARAAGFSVWLDPTIYLEHLATVPISIKSMGAIYSALHGGGA